VIQQLRWNPPGGFKMGSPEKESHRFDDEGPLHDVAIGHGFWMCETACSRALWNAVMRDERGEGEPGLPVTEVSWHDVQKFLSAINTSIPGLDLGVPSEAQWEYACRAGTQTRFYTGDEIGRDHANFASAGPVPVGSLPPNPWGLCEMHGNVWEWCADHWHDNYDGAPADGSAWIDRGGGVAGRVVRGGSWFVGARCVRAACRGHAGPADRGGLLGFRCARVPVSGGEAASAAPANGRQAERRPSQGPADAAGRLGDDGATLPRARRVIVRSDRDELTVARITKPDWASAMGRDRFGLFAELSVAGKGGGEVIQRLRWVPPGHFREIPGIGEARVAKYGKAFLEVLKQASLPASPAKEVPAHAAVSCAHRQLGGPGRGGYSVSAGHRDAVATGKLTPDEAEPICAMLTGRIKLIEVTDHAVRLESLERKAGLK
jgi:hypothetical protein